MKNWYSALLLVLTVASGHFVGCTSPKPEPTQEELQKIEAEIVAGESGL